MLRSNGERLSRLPFVVGYHQWVVVTPAEVREWDGQTPIELRDGPFLVVVDALFKRSLAVYDTESAVLTSYNLRL